jgi:PDZ domain
MIRSLAILILSLAVSVSGADKLSVIRVNVTSQGWDFLRPWGKRQPSTKRAIGAVVKTAAGPRALVTGDLVQNATFLEFENAEGGKKVPAAVEFVDYEANLALIKTEDAEFLKGVPQLEIGESKTGDELGIWQLENNGRLLVTKGPMTTAEVTSYPVDGSFLIYRITVQLQGRDSSFTLPVVNGGKLTGILMSYDSQSNNANLIPAPVIAHFLKDAADGKYDGFPRASYGFSPMRDPALRRFAKVPAEVTGGVYVTEVLKDGPAAQAGLLKGDVLVAVDEFAVDQDGNYPDPEHGKVSLAHLISDHRFVGDTVKFHILRGGVKQTLDVKLAHRNPRDYVSDPYIIDRAPRFYVVGGLILQELSRQYLREFGSGGERGSGGRRPPARLMYYDRYQNDLFKDGPKKIVFLSRVLPTPATVGYEEIGGIVIKKINGVELQSLDDVPKALEKPVNGFHEFVFEEDPTKIYLDANEVEKTDKVVQAQYRLPAMRRLE